MTREGEELRALSREGKVQLPCMTTTAVGILALARQPPEDNHALLRVVQHDPALVTALLAAAGRDHRARCATVRSAVERLGLSNALRVCLDFQLVDPQCAAGIDYIRHWRHTLLTAAYARAIAQRLRRPDQELLRTAALLRNLGTLLVDRDGHGMDGAGCAGWLARQGISHRLCKLIRTSHQPATSLAQTDYAAACVLLAATMAEVWLRANWEETLWQTRTLAQQLFGEIPDLCEWLYGVLGPQADDLEVLLGIRLPHRRQVDSLYREARVLKAEH